MTTITYYMLSCYYPYISIWRYAVVISHAVVRYCMSTCATALQLYYDMLLHATIL